jgi:hypothetical protein
MNLFRYLEGASNYLLTGGEIHAFGKYMSKDTWIQRVPSGKDKEWGAGNRDFGGAQKAISADLF